MRPHSSVHTFSHKRWRIKRIKLLDTTRKRLQAKASVDHTTFSFELSQTRKGTQLNPKHKKKQQEVSVTEHCRLPERSHSESDNLVKRVDFSHCQLQIKKRYPILPFLCLCVYPENKYALQIQHTIQVNFK